MHNTIAHLGGQVERLDAVDHAQALFVVAEALRADFVQCGFARVAKRRMPEVVAEGNGFGQVFVQAQGARNGTPDLRNFEGMGQAGAVVVALRGDEYLRLVGQAAKRLGMDDAVAVTLETGAVRAGGQGPLPSSGGGGARRPAAQRLRFLRFDSFTDRHIKNPSPPRRNHLLITNTREIGQNPS